LFVAQLAFTNDLTKVAPGRAQYTHLLDEADASVLDDIIVWWVDDDVFDVMPNASNTDRVRAAIGGTETTHDRAVFAVQGPRAKERLATVFPEAAAVGRFRVSTLNWEGTPCVVAGTGYTGEAGVEIAIPKAAANDLWAAITGAGITPAGLGARDTLRLEAGMPLYGNELGRETTPFDAGLGHVVRFAKSGDFVGRRALEQAAELEPHTRLYGLVIRGRGIARHGYPVYCPGAGLPCGTVTSGAPSPTLGMAIAMAYLSDLTIKPGDRLEVGIRRERVEAEAVTLPFYRREGNGNGRSR
jgi:aminomethyltransferase